MGETPDEQGQQDERAQMEHPHVFVANNSPEILGFIREVLQDEQYLVTTTTFVPDTFEQIAALGPDVLVIDVAVGERAGWDLLERLREEAATSEIPGVVVSTDPRLLERAQAEAECLGGRAFLAKPFDLDAMLGTIQDLIGPA